MSASSDTRTILQLRTHLVELGTHTFSHLGSFAPAQGQLECDARFVFCAFAICYMLDDWSSINVDAAVGFLLRTQVSVKRLLHF